MSRRLPRRHAAPGPWVSPSRYEPDRAHLADYARLAASEEGFAAYCAAHVTGSAADDGAGLIAAE